MWTNRLIFFGPAVAALLALSPTGVSAQGVSLTGGTVVCPENLNDGSCNLVFRNRTELTGLTDAQLNETVFRSCPGFPNGAYNHANTNIDYVILPVSNVNSNTMEAGPLSPGQIEDQIGAIVPNPEAQGTAVLIEGTSGNNPTVTVKIEDPNNPLKHSQIIDLPGFDFILFEKSQGGGAQVATLVCDLKMWFRGMTSIEYGLQSFNVQHAINSMRIGFVAGPSGMKSQENAKGACLRAGNDAGAVDTDLEKQVSYLAGIYKVTAESQANPSNVTGCGLDDTPASEGGPLPVLANYCDASELAGTSEAERPNACNPQGEGGGVPEANVAGVNGNASTCYFTSRGTTYSFSC